MAHPSTEAGQPTGHPAPARHAVSAPILLFGLLGAPAVAALETLIGMGAVGHACFPADHPLEAPLYAPQPIVWAAHLIALAVAVLSVLASFRAWGRTRHEHEGGREAMLEIGEGRTRFLAMTAVLTSLGFLILIVFNTVGLVVLHPC